MVEPHVFCGPEFLLRASLPQASDVLAGQSEALVQLQRDIYDVCTESVRRRVYQSYYTQHVGKSSSSTQTMTSMVPAAPSTLFFVEVTPPQSLTANEQASVQQSRKALGLDSTSNSVDDTTSNSDSSEGVVYTLLMLTDSRIAAEVYMLLLRRGALALSLGCRLHLYYRATARAAPPLSRTDLLARREAQRARMNMDEDLWSALQEGLSEELVQRVLTSEVTSTSAPRRLLTRAEEHEQQVRRLLHYCEQEVQYAGVLDEKERASPFLLAMGLFMKLQLTTDDLMRYFVRHPRRVVRALALFLARYLVAPEELMPFFQPCMQDAIVISCAADASETCAMQDMALDLLRKEELNEAWLPVYHPYWLSHVIEPAIMAAMAQPTHSSTTTGQAVDTVDDTEKETADKPISSDTPLGPIDWKRGRGVAASLGFRSIAALANFARQQSSTLVPQRLTTVLARHRRTAAHITDNSMDDDSVDDDDDGSESSSEEHLIHVDVAPSKEGKTNDMREEAGGVWLAGQASLAQHDSEAGRSTAATNAHNVQRRAVDDVVVNAHSAAMAQGSALLLALLGRTRPFDRNDPHYLQY